MKKFKFVLLAMFIIARWEMGHAQNKTGESFLSDFQILITSIKELHPTLYKNITKEEFDKEVIHTSEKLLNTNSRYKAIYIIQELLYKIGNGHAGNVSVYNGDLDVTKALPFSVYILEHKLYICQYPSDTSFNGTEIYSIGTSNASTIIDSLKIFFPVDGRRDIINYMLQPFFNCLYGAFISQKDTFLVNTQKGLIKAAAARKDSGLFDKLIVRKNWEEYFGNESGFKSEVNTKYGYFRFERFEGKKVEKEFSSFVETLNMQKTNAMIIDLRYNNGGEALMAGRMASLLALKPFRVFAAEYITSCAHPTYNKYMDNRINYKLRIIKSIPHDSLRKVVRFEPELNELMPAPNRFKGKVYIITGSITLSSATLFCQYLKGQPNITFVGSETSGAINYMWAGTICNLYLPNLNTYFAFGTELLEMKANSSITELPEGLLPEHTINYSIHDLQQKKDKEMEWIKNDLSNSN
jgi:hypothetical protein